MATIGNNHTRSRELTTKDDVPLTDLIDYGLTLIDLYREAPRNFIGVLTQEVSERMFMQRLGDMTWHEVAELEHPKTGSLSSKSMAFSVKSYARDLGYSREHIEDNPSELLKEEFSKLIEGGEKKQFEVLFDVMKNGIADGTQLWFDPPEHGDFTFTNTHDHTFATTQELFEADGDTDANAHTLSDHIREAQVELAHHGYRGDVVFVSNKFANTLIQEYLGTSFYIPMLEDLREGNISDMMLRVGGAVVVQTAWLSGMTAYLFDSSQKPIKTHTVRPMELTDNRGAPVGGAGGSYGDPGALLGVYGSMRFGAKLVNPLAGVKFTADNISSS